MDLRLATNTNIAYSTAFYSVHDCVKMGDTPSCWLVFQCHDDSVAGFGVMEEWCRTTRVESLYEQSSFSFFVTNALLEVQNSCATRVS